MGMGKKPKPWVCDPCQHANHLECWYSSAVAPADLFDEALTEELICDCPCEPFPLPGFPGEQPGIPRRRDAEDADWLAETTGMSADERGWLG